MIEVLYLIRHGELPVKYQGHFIGRTDPSLSKRGKKDCEYLRTLAVERVYSSPLLRARETAELIRGECVVDERLAEMNFGEWENFDYEDIAAVCEPEVLEGWSLRPEEMTFPGGENVKDFFRRVDEVFAEIEAAGDCRTAAVVTHGGVLMRILCRIDNLPTSRQAEVQPPRGTMVKIVRNGDGRWVRG